MALIYDDAREHIARNVNKRYGDCRLINATKLFVAPKEVKIRSAGTRLH